MKKKRFFKEVACLLVEENDCAKLCNEFVELASFMDLKSLTLTKGAGKRKKTIGQSSLSKSTGKHELLIDLYDGQRVVGLLTFTSDSKLFHKKKIVEQLTSVACLFASLLKKPIAKAQSPVKTKPQPKKAKSRSIPLQTLDEVNKSYIEEVLAACDGKIHGKGGAAEILGLNGNTLRNRMDKLGVAYKKNDYPKRRRS